MTNQDFKKLHPIQKSALVAKSMAAHSEKFQVFDEWRVGFLRKQMIVCLEQQGIQATETDLSNHFVYQVAQALGIKVIKNKERAKDGQSA